MITDELKAQVESLSSEDRTSLSSYLLKLRLENDEEYWKSIREKTADYAPEASSNHVDTN